MEARILYSGDREWTGPIDQIDEAPRTDVLIISVQDGDGVRCAQASGFDHYCLAHRSGLTLMGGEQVMLFGWDDGDYQWRSAGNPPVDSPPPLAPWHTTFQGVRVVDQEWEAAQAKLTRS